MAGELISQERDDEAKERNHVRAPSGCSLLNDQPHEIPDIAPLDNTGSLPQADQIREIASREKGAKPCLPYPVREVLKEFHDLREKDGRGFILPAICSTII